MLSTYWGVVRDGKIEPREPAALPEGAQVLLTVISEEEVGFWQQVSEESLKKVWDNAEDDVYVRLVQR
jgi:hypothetical protein